MLFNAETLTDFYGGDGGEALGFFKKKKKRRPPPGPTPQQTEAATREAAALEASLSAVRDLSNRLAAAGLDAMGVDSALSEAEYLADEAREAAASGNVGHIRNLARQVSSLIQRAKSEAARVESRARAEQAREAAEQQRMAAEQQRLQAQQDAELQRITAQQQAEQQRLQQQLSMEQQRAQQEMQMQQQRMAMEMATQQQQQAMLMQQQQAAMAPMMQPQFPMQMQQQPMFLDPYSQASYGYAQQAPQGYGQPQVQMLPAHMPEMPPGWGGGGPIEDQMVLLGDDDARRDHRRDRKRRSRTERLKKALRRGRDQVRAEVARFQRGQAELPPDSVPSVLEAEVVDYEPGLGSAFDLVRPARVLNPAAPGATIEYGYKLWGPIGPEKRYEIERPDRSRFRINSPRNAQIDPASKRVVYHPPKALTPSGKPATVRVEGGSGGGMLDWLSKLVGGAATALSARSAPPAVASQPRAGGGVGLALGVAAAAGLGYVGWRALSRPRARRRR